MFVVIYQCFIIHTFLMFHGIVARQVQLNGNITENIGKNDTKLTCNFTMDQGDLLNYVMILAKNITLHDFEDVASFDPDFDPKLQPCGKVLFGKASLSPVNRDSKRVSMSFDNLNCKHSRLYKCRLNVKTKDNPSITIESEAIRISVQVPPTKPENISLVYIQTDLSITQTKYMNYSNGLQFTTVTSTETDNLSTLKTSTQTDTTVFNNTTLPTNDHTATYSTPSNGHFSSNISYRTTTFSTQQTTTAQGIPEGYNITVVCTGDVGKPPAEHFFQKYRSGHSLSMTYKASKTSISDMSENCSYYRTSSLTFQVTAKDNNAVIRCVVNSSTEEPDMYVETAPIKVYSDKSTPSTSSSGGNKAKVSGIVVVVLIVIGVVIAVSNVLYRRNIKIEDYKPVDNMESNTDQIESQKANRGVPSTNSTKKTTGYEDVDLDNTDMKFKPSTNEETIAKVKQDNDEYLKKQREDEDKEKDNPTTPPQAAVYACVNKPKFTVTIENNTTAGQQEEDLYEESKEGIYDTSGDRRHKENITAENYNSTENLKNEESDHDEQKSQVGAYINKAFENDSGNKEEKRQVATVSPTVRLSFGYQGDGQNKNKSNEIQPKNTNQPVKPKGQPGSTEKQSNQETSL